MQHSTKYVVGFVTALTAIVAVVLSLLFTTWEAQSKVNEAIFNKRAILSAVTDYLEGEDPEDMEDSRVLEIFDSQVEQKAIRVTGEEVGAEVIQSSGYIGGKPENIDMAKEKKKDLEDRVFPLYIFNSPKGKLYIVSVRGKGLWDEIWGNVALKPDFSTIAGVVFDHKGETPGLGAEIKDNPSFPAKFKGKTFYDANGNYVGVDVLKGVVRGDDPHNVDGISGATVTCVGVGEMLQKGIKYYEPYFEKIGKKNVLGQK
ncbi:MAG: NADH:ubiquinone reductase (Na(+)-transporting) subunit C [Saprospiraceae bacterium]|nr:NADH:ubiquinone reductase (Na(+)-transporting) subunit C [Saprospiraceae bacterium]